MAAFIGCGRLGYEETSHTPLVDSGFDAGSLDAGSSEVAPPTDAVLAQDVAVAVPDAGALVDAEPATDAAGGDVADDAGTAGMLCGNKLLGGGLFCETFESAESLANPTVSQGAVAERSTSVVFEGTHSFRARVPGTMGEGLGAAYLTRTFGPPRSEGPLFVRAFMFLPSDVETRRDWMVFLKLFASDDLSAGSKISFDLVDRDALQLAVNPAGQFPRSATNAVPRNRWICVEMAMVLGAAGSAGEARAFIDGDLRLSVPEGTATVGALGVNALQFGIDAAGDRGTSEIFFDNVAVATGRIGCQ